METVYLYIDWGSQPSRAVASFCIINNIPHVIQETKLFEGQTRTKEFKAISPPMTVPAITHNGLSLYESHAILTYLCNVFPIEDH